MLAALIFGVLYFGGPIKDFLQSGLNGIKDTTKKLTDFVGITDSESEKAVQAEIAKDDNCFNPRFYHALPKTHQLSYGTAKQIATDIHDAIVGTFGFTVYVDGNKVQAQIQKCAYQVNVSYVAEVFNVVYNVDMLAFIKSPGFFRSGLNTDSLEKIITYAKNLPLY